LKTQAPNVLMHYSNPYIKKKEETQSLTEV
jgi:hypothetical protein